MKTGETKGTEHGTATAVPEPVPGPTLWPAALALSSTLLLWGLISSLIITALGGVAFIVSLAGWIRDIRHEHRS